jgi:peroxiredoxin Q/BCP
VKQVLSIALGALVVAALATRANGDDKELKVGDKVPALESIDENGKPWKSTDVVGKKILVLYFYPADFTGGCTAQACGFRDNLETLKSKDVEVVGISGDTPKTHQLFKKYHKLPFTLLSDEKGELAKKFGVKANVKEGKAKGFDEQGKEIEVIRSATISRVTVVIDKQGNVAAIDAIAKAGDDAKRVAELVQKLKKK